MVTNLHWRQLSAAANLAYCRYEDMRAWAARYPDATYWACQMEKAEALKDALTDSMREAMGR